MHFRLTDVAPVPVGTTDITEEKMSQTSHGRFYQRLALFKGDGKAYPRLRHFGFWLIHNCLVHPLLGVVPRPFVLDLHELSSRWLNQKRNPFVFPFVYPKIPSYFLWFFHNVFAHILIGVFPIRPMFAFHDWTATLMGVPDWV
jgi:hypothetical protein